MADLSWIWKRFMEFTRTTAVYPGAGESDTQEATYLVVGLANESGEVLGVLKKHLRGDYDLNAMKEKLKKELSDCLWYLARICDAFDISLGELIAGVTKKLEDRKERGVLQGSGDER